MKKIVLFSLGILFGTNIIAQKISMDNVPAEVKSTFTHKYSTAQKVKWQLDYENYEAEFNFLNTDMSAFFDKDGNWLETHHFIKSSELPKEIKDSLSKHFGTLLSMYKIDDVEKVESKDKDLFYKLEVEKGENTYYMMLSEKGETLKKDLIEKEDETPVKGKK